MAEGDQDKTEQPTSFRLDEARKKGEVAKSADMVGVLMLSVFAVTLMLTATGVVLALVGATRQVFDIAGARPALGMEFTAWVGQAYAPLVQALAPLVMALLVTAIVANVVQTGPIFTAHPIKPDFKRMNPKNAVQRLFSMRGLWELGRLVVKLMVLAGLCWWVTTWLATFVGSIAMSTPDQLPTLLLGAIWKTSIYVLLVLALTAVADLLFTRKDYMRRMRMSRRELRDETKRRDGNPEVKSKQKQQIRELLKKVRSLPRVADADVILINPTEFAVALQYRPKTMRAPVVLAKGRGFLAARVRAIAMRKGVPILRSPKLARALYRECEIDAPVPEELYGSLAPIYRQIFASKRKAVSV